MSEPRFCISCDGVHEQTRREAEWRWLCSFSPRTPRPAFTSPGALLDPPFERATKVNVDGNCPLYRPRRQKGDAK